MYRDSIGSSAIVNDLRWGGAFGVDVDFVALGHVAVEYIKISDIEVHFGQASSLELEFGRDAIWSAINA